jgi:hypothetical protein
MPLADAYIWCFEQGGFRRPFGQEPLVVDVLAKPKLFLIGTEHDFAKFAGHP